MSNPHSNGRDQGSYDQLEQSLVAPEEALPTTSATPMIEVIAPATLSEGYKFEVQLGDRTLEITVPQGGVEGGQRFMVALPENSGGQVIVPKINVPVGHWKDGLCDCFTYGPFHNHCCISCFCPLIAAGHVISRLKLNVWAKPGPVSESAGAFQKLVTMTVAYSCLSMLLFIVCLPYDLTDQEGNPVEPPSAIFMLMVIRSCLHYGYLGILILVLWNLRAHVRSKYAIPEMDICNTGCEDLLCSVFCSHCSVAQLLRHTTDYDTYNATCCTDTGVPPNVPSIV